MNCYECKLLMLDYLKGKLSKSVEIEMEEHLNECSNCSNIYSNAHEDEKGFTEGLFWDLLKPSGGFKRFFLMGAIFTLVLVWVLISIKIGKPVFSLF